jgi:hypothetical protein
MRFPSSVTGALVSLSPWKRAEEFFERTVKNGQPMTSASPTTRQ